MTKQLLKPEWIITVDSNFSVLTDHVLIIQNNTIASARPANKVRDSDFDQVYDLPGQALLPGFINTHTHAAMSLMRGVADDIPLMDWLNHHIWPIESQWVNKQFVQDGTELAIAEMIRSGTTCFNDMYFFPEQTAATSQNLGMRCSAGLIILDFPTIWAQSAEEYIHKGLDVFEQLKSMDLISACFAPHAPYTVSNAPLEKIAMYSSELGIPVHMHIHETQHEVDEALKNTGQRPLQRLDELGLLNDSLIAVHMTELNTLEIERISEAGVHIAHCPESNLKLASGICPVDTLLNQGLNVTLGTDGAASNNDLDMLLEARSAALLGKGISGNAAALDAKNMIKMLTINGAKALGLNDTIGSIEPGKKADLISFNLQDLNTTPVYDPVSQIIYAANSRQISHVWIDGVLKLKNHQFTDLDIASIKQKSYDWQCKIT